jgi:hypothetical protein
VAKKKAVEPITPREAEKRNGITKSGIPDVVFETFNNLIAEKFNGHTSTFSQTEVMLKLHNAGLKSSIVFDRGYLDVDGYYRKAGWKVRYDKPGPGEGGRPTFTFEKG